MRPERGERHLFSRIRMSPFWTPGGAPILFGIPLLHEQVPSYVVPARAVRYWGVFSLPPQAGGPAQCPELSGLPRSQAFSVSS